MTLTVISGAQIGADIAGLRAAKNAGFPTAGWIPLGRRTRHGPLSWELVHYYGLTETDSEGYPIRTEKNVVSSDATMRFCHSWYTPGEKLTQRLAIKHKKPRWDVELRKNDRGLWTPIGFDRGLTYEYAQMTAHWILDHEVQILNIAGNADTDIEFAVESFLTLVFGLYRDMSQGEG